jgi:rod shape-determining protein MreD
MAIDTLKRAVMFLILCLTQALVLNHIHLFNYATPLLYVYLVVVFPRNYPKWAILLWSFLLGLSIDMFANTPGVASASLTLVGAIQPYLLELMVPRDAIEKMPASAKELGATKFLLLATVLTFIHCLAFFTLETFNFFNWVNWLLCIASSTVLTVVLILVIENVRKKA